MPIILTSIPETCKAESSAVREAIYIYMDDALDDVEQGI